MSHDENSLPWTEEQWEAFMRKSDLRAARYSDLLETLMDEPDRDAIIDHEMGWDKEDGETDDEADREWIEEMNQAFEETAEAVERGENPADEEALEQDPGELLPESVLDDEEDRDELDESDRQLHRIPAYHLAMALSQKIDNVLRPLMNRAGQEPPEEIEQAFIQIKIAAVKIAGGHGMGYDDDVLGGNVVNCKFARTAANECRKAIQSLAQLEVISAETASVLLEELTTLQNAIDSRIAELRARMWWQK